MEGWIIKLYSKINRGLMPTDCSRNARFIKQNSDLKIRNLEFRIYKILYMSIKMKL